MMKVVSEASMLPETLTTLSSNVGRRMTSLITKTPEMKQNVYSR